MQAMQLFEALEDRGQKAIALLHVGQVHAHQSSSEEALRWLGNSFDLAQEVGDERVCADIYRTIGDMYSKNGDIAQARAHYERALEIAAGIKHRQWEYELHELLAQIHEHTGDTARALIHYRQYMQIKDEVQDERRQQFMSEIQTRFNVEKSEREKEIYRLKNIELAEALQKVESLNQHLEEINNEKNEFIGIVAHDLKNPISGLSMSLSLLSNYLSRMTPEEVSRQVGLMNKTVQRMEAIVSKLLDINIIDSGKVSFQPTRFDLNEVICAVMDDYGDRMREKNIAAYFDLPEREVPVYADKNATLEVLDNLISNAVKYSPRDTTITVRSRMDTTVARFIIEDAGPGIAPEDFDKLFKKFVRLGAQPTGGESSTGLGLSIVKKLVDAMNGRVWCESELGKGASFMVELPVAQ